MICAIDCDLRRIHCVDETGAVVMKGSPVIGPFLAHLATFDRVLFEIASPVDYTDHKGAAHQKRRWTIWNVAMASFLSDRLGGCQFLVSPSSAWTQGYNVKQRHALAKATAPTKDLRECQAMIASFKRDPTKWVTLGSFLDAL